MNDLEEDCANIRKQERKEKYCIFFYLHVECEAADLSQKAQRGGCQNCMTRGKGKVLVKGTLELTGRIDFSVPLYCMVNEVITVYMSKWLKHWICNVLDTKPCKLVRCRTC